jgi:deazaflavin-dependent oxidoreductase (nitroreductase family)
MSTLVTLYRWSGGAIGGRVGTNRVLLLTTTGRRSGRPHTVPVGYFDAGDTLYIVASNSGSPRHPAWYVNLLVNPSVTIQRGRTVQTATAVPAEGERRLRLWEHLLTVAPSYGRYQHNNTREIPIVVLQPTT